LKKGSLPDANINIRDYDDIYGLSANLQVNNIPNQDYHRLNGFTKYRSINTFDAFLWDMYRAMTEKVKDKDIKDKHVKNRPEPSFIDHYGTDNDSDDNADIPDFDSTKKKKKKTKKKKSTSKKKHKSKAKISKESKTNVKYPNAED
jgi:hypothetical protein